MAELHDDMGVDKTEAAKFLGVHPLTVHRRTVAGEIPSYRIGRARRWRMSALRAYVDRLEREDAEGRTVDKGVNGTDTPPATAAA